MQDFIYWILIAVAIGLFLCQKFLFKKNEKSIWIERFKQDVQKYKKFITKSDYLTTKSEWEFLWRLLDYTKNKDVLICTKVRVWDIIQVKNFSNWNRKLSISSRLDRSHFDFVCLQKSTLKIICVIELDDITHETKTAKERDETKNYICEFLKIPLIRFNSSTPSADDFAQKGL